MIGEKSTLELYGHSLFTDMNILINPTGPDRKVHHEKNSKKIINYLKENLLTETFEELKQQFKEEKIK